MTQQSPDLITRCRKDERKAQSELYQLWFSDLMRMASRYKKNKEDAVALVNIGFFKVFTNLDKYNNSVPFEAWIRRIMMNTIIDEYRKKRKYNMMEVVETDIQPMQEAESDYNLAERKFEVEELEQIMNALDEQERIVFNLFEIDGYSHKEIAEMMNVSERSSKRYLARAKGNLKTMMNTLSKTFGIAL